MYFKLLVALIITVCILEYSVCEDSVGDFGQYGNHRAIHQRGQNYLNYITNPYPPRQNVSFRKVIVPAVYKEWLHYGMPDWVTNRTMQELYNYEVFLYQKSNRSAPNFLSMNQGLESGVYLRYIVDHYYNFPDIAIFVHGWPSSHNPKWFNYVKCVRPNATYMHINSNIFTKGRSIAEVSRPAERIWVEQCWRDVLRINFQLENDINTFNRMFPTNGYLRVSVECCSQFILSRKNVLAKPYTVWRKLYQIIGNQTVCHKGEPDFKNLYAGKLLPMKSRKQYGPEPANLDPRPGGRTQVSAAEHLTHIIYGDEKSLKSQRPSMEYVCSNFYESLVCPGSPCRRGLNYDMLLQSPEFTAQVANRQY